MRLAFISDIHGNAIALDAVLKDLEQRDIDKIFVLGDISYRGPEPQRSIDSVRSLNADVIKGNADEWIVRGINENEVPESVLGNMKQEQEWAASRLNEDSIAYLRDLPTVLSIEADSVDIHAFHATPNSLFNAIQPNESDEMLEKSLLSNDANIFIYGHIHKPYVRFINGKCIINTGSVGLPFDGLNKSSYAIVETESDEFKVSIIRVDYEINKVIKQLKESDYPNKELLINMIENARV